MQSATRPLSIVILGAGAVGGYLGGRLANAGSDVTFLVREGRAAQLRAHGLAITSPLGNVATPVTAITDTAGRAPADVVMLSCKAYDLDAALDAVAPLLGAETRLVPLLNGVRHVDDLAAHGLPSMLVPGIVHGAVDLRPDGTVAHLNPFFTVTAGTVTGAPDETVDAFTAALAAAGVTARVSPSIRDDLWAKLVFLAALAGATSLMRASIGAIVAAPGGAALVEGLFAECRAVAEAEGARLDPRAIDGFRTALLHRGSPLTASMLRDIEAGRRVESEHVLGDLLRRGRAHGLDTPRLTIAYTHVKAYESERARRAGKAEDA